MLDATQELAAMPEVRRDALTWLRQLRETGEPIVLAINGQAEFVVQDDGTYQQLVELVDRLETLEVIREGIAAADRGEGRPAEEVFAEIRRKHGFPPQP